MINTPALHLQHVFTDIRAELSGWMAWYPQFWTTQNAQITVLNPTDIMNTVAAFTVLSYISAGIVMG
jgi:hypothetical protein